MRLVTVNLFVCFAIWAKVSLNGFYNQKSKTFLLSARVFAQETVTALFGKKPVLFGDFTAIGFANSYMNLQSQIYLLTINPVWTFPLLNYLLLS